MTTEFLGIIPVLPSEDIARDTAWYLEKVGFETYFADKMYAVLYRNNLCIHLQWHANTDEDPLLGGSVVRFPVKHIEALFEEFVTRGTVETSAFRPKTNWGTKEFGFFDLNKNALFFMEDLV